MSYFSDESETLGINFEMLASEQDLIIFKENRELILMGVQSFSLKQFREIRLCYEWTCCVSKTRSLHMFCYL